jgi:hypothetical protein
VVDGTVDELRWHFDVPFGFGGLTLPDRGYPVPCRLLMGEMARLECSFSFLRRSFRRDVRGLDVAAAVKSMRCGLDSAFRRSAAGEARDRRLFRDAVAGVLSEAQPR